MKTNVLFRKSTCLLALLFALAANLSLNAQTTGELVFNNPSLESGTAGNDGAVYRFPTVSTNMDALLTIKGRSSAAVALNNIDLPSMGQDKAFQPQVRYGTGNVSGAITWWLEFEVVFVTKNTSNPVILTNFNLTALDIDGNNDKLREMNSFYSPGLYTLETPTSITVNDLVVSSATVGKSFTGSLIDHPGIDTSATDLMASVTYFNSSSTKFRVGGATTGSTGSANRMHSIWFKGFTFNNPVTLPVKLASFTATLNNTNADLKWTTASEINASHFVVERSLDGRTFTDAGMVFAMGNSADAVNYSFADNLSQVTVPVVYYRLRSVDMDAKTTYSETRIIRLTKMKENTVSIVTYPNPVSNELRITVPSGWQNKPVLYELYAMNGQVARRIQSASSGQTETLNVSTLARGLYVVKVTCEGVVAQQKIVKQ